MPLRRRWEKAAEGRRSPKPGGNPYSKPVICCSAQIADVTVNSGETEVLFQNQKIVNVRPLKRPVRGQSFYAVKSSLLLSFLESVPAVLAKLKTPNTADRKFEEVVKSAQDAAVLVLVY